jgi:phenylpropionate dioxygenase-like ring-hydroxylating dioxygenase large terminal subunit
LLRLFLFAENAGMIEKQLWHPVVASHEVTDAPVGVALLDESVVLWREPGHEGTRGQVHAWADRCPHRGARLSLGRVLNHLHGARLECPYHGWQFAGDAAAAQTGASCARCVHVPAAPEFVPPASHAVTAFEAREVNGLIWVRLASPVVDLPPALMEPPAYAPWNDAEWRQLMFGPYDLQTSAPRMVENFIDLSHFGFVHEGWLGARSHAQVETGRVEEGDQGVQAHHCRAWQPRGYAGDAGGIWVDYRYEVPHPFAAILFKDATQGDPISNAFALFIRPDGDERCTAWFAMALKNDPSEEETIREFQETVFSQDCPVVESQMPRRLPIGKEAPIREVHSPADRMSSAYRRYLQRLGIKLGVC